MAHQEFEVNQSLELNSPTPGARENVHNLPSSLREWRAKYPAAGHWDLWGKTWNSLRPFFESKGYTLFLYEYPAYDCAPIPDKDASPASDSFGLYGDREGHLSRFSGDAAIVYAARDRLNRDVVIKAIRKGDEGKNEHEILLLLSSQPLRSKPANTTVPILEFLQYRDWHFVVMPCCYLCTKKPFLDASEVLEFAEQVMSVLSFLHDNCIAHLDIAPQNILVNFYGKVPDTEWVDVNGQWTFGQVPEWRSTFPVRYMLMDFDLSFYSNDKKGPGQGWLVETHRLRHTARVPPDVEQSDLFDPYAADVFQTATMLYNNFSNVTRLIPGLLELFQDMTDPQPERRISMAIALAHLRQIRSKVANDEMLLTTLVQLTFDIHPVPMRQ